MSLREITKLTAHRPWPVPSSPWIMTQRWSDLLFAHWPIAPNVMRELIPDELTLDTFDGEAWVALVPFRMSNVRPRFCPALPWLSAFPEFNVRTYVRANKSKDVTVAKPGVYFFSLEATNPIAVAMARWIFKLPYFRARYAANLRQGADRIQIKTDSPWCDCGEFYRNLLSSWTRLSK